MKIKLSVCIVAALVVGLTACSTNNKSKNVTLKEPPLVLKPIRYSGRTWFDTDKHTLRPSGKKELEALSQYLINAKQRGLITGKDKVIIIGHTDSRAPQQYNQKLSERRAATVVKFLSDRNIPAMSMLVFGKGETQPVASNRTREGMQKNRRVEIHIFGSGINVVYD